MNPDLPYMMRELADQWQQWTSGGDHKCNRNTKTCVDCRARATINVLRDAASALDTEAKP
jgi:hypothetical protein